MFAAVHIFDETNIVRNDLGIVVNYARGFYPKQLWLLVDSIFARDVLAPHPTDPGKRIILSVDNRSIFPELE